MHRSRLLFLAVIGFSAIWVSGRTSVHSLSIDTDSGTVSIKPVADNAVRIRFCKDPVRTMPEWVYTSIDTALMLHVENTDSTVAVSMPGISLTVDRRSGRISYFDKNHNPVLAEIGRSLTASAIQGEPTYIASATFDSPTDEVIMGLGQFQDGHLNVRGLSRRLTQVNTQISVPLTVSSRGYGILWNNYGLTEYNPGDETVMMQKLSSVGGAVEVNVTSTSGGKKEIRQDNIFSCTVDIPRSGEYALLLDVGQTMARHHNLSVDDSLLVNIDNLWLPPTTSVKAYLDKGAHTFTARLDKNDSPVLHYRLADSTTTYLSPVADCVDYTVFAGDADEVVATYRKVSGGTPMMPLWSLGYIHCRERYRTQDQWLSTARTFREMQIPVDVIVQDWQYWGRNGWNAMEFDSESYPDPKTAIDSLHSLDKKLMLSVWSKVDPASSLGRQMEEKGLFIPGTSWVDFFNPEAAQFYWAKFSDRLLKLGVDAWWQDATEPENDDLLGRKVNAGTIPGEIFRNVYPLLVNKTVYEGCRADDPARRTMILTRSAFPGIQRYATAMWSGDVGNDWQTFRLQIVAGLGFCAAGMPWWTYDAGGFFRPADQHTNPAYIETMLRWIQTSTFLPMMRVHGYMSDTEPWLYGEEARDIVRDYINLRYRLLPYIYSEAAMVSRNGSTIMRPMIFDFSHDKAALSAESQFMFGHSLLINPVTAPGATSWTTYLPATQGGWYDFWSGKKYDGGLDVTIAVDINKIPVFVKAGSIIPMADHGQSTAEAPADTVELNIYPGADASFDIYYDDGTTYAYESGDYSIVPLRWDDKSRTLTIGRSSGNIPPAAKHFTIKAFGQASQIDYSGQTLKVKL